MFDYKKPSYAVKYFKRWYEKVTKSHILDENGRYFYPMPLNK
ncbi:hypothetical protein [Petrotoga sp. HKA.pet.4.5]|nr:hypothetical protein [Petrotoga sp. HKA.pet.4.5]